MCDQVKEDSEVLSEGYYIDDTLKKLFHMTSLICYVLINFASYEQIDNCPKKGHKKIPPNLKTNSEGNLGYNKITHPNIVFFIW